MSSEGQLNGIKLDLE